MKKIIYRKIWLDNSLTSSEVMIYSLFVLKSMRGLSFEADGNFDISKTISEINDLDNCIPFETPSIRYIAKELSMSVGAVSKAIKSLKDNGLLSDESLYVTESILDGGYFELYSDDVISKKKELQLTYSYLKSRSVKFNGIVTATTERLAKEMNMTKSNLKQQFHRLSILGYISRKDDESSLEIL